MIDKALLSPENTPDVVKYLAQDGKYFYIEEYQNGIYQSIFYSIHNSISKEDIDGITDEWTIKDNNKSYKTVFEIYGARYLSV